MVQEEERLLTQHQQRTISQVITGVTTAEDQWQEQIGGLGKKYLNVNKYSQAIENIHLKQLVGIWENLWLFVLESGNMPQIAHC